jgi:hypothetical protein
VLERGLDRLRAGVRQHHDVVADPAAQRLSQPRRAGPDRCLGLERHLLVEAAARRRDQIGMMVAEEIGAVAADQIQDRHEPSLAP